jgi:hypothetical protein
MSTNSAPGKMKITACDVILEVMSAPPLWARATHSRLNGAKARFLEYFEGKMMVISPHFGLHPKIVVNKNMRARVDKN